MFEAVGYRVKHLLRVRVGNLRLADLPRGHWRVLTKRELTALANTDNSLLLPTMKLNDCSALITGASSGIGSEFARQLANHARAIVLVARRSERLADLRDELLNRNPNLDVHVRVVDLADKAQIESLIDSLARDKIDVDLLINNAGLGDSGPFAASDPIRNEQMALVNIVALTSLTRQFASANDLRNGAAAS